MSHLFLFQESTDENAFNLNYAIQELNVKKKIVKCEIIKMLSDVFIRLGF